jgi:ribosomal protein S18 acetylase RimI-like enzyme
MPAIIIRRMRESHLHALYRLGRQEWPADGWLSMAYLRCALHQPSIARVALSGKTLVGGIIIVKEDIVPFWLRYLIVEDDQRRLGIATRLLETACATIPAGTSLHVDTGVSDEPALAFYRKQQFEEIGVLSGLYGKEDGMVLRRRIG